MIEIDGGFGEGGGQVLRTSLSLSCLLNKPFRIFNIRIKRKKPGLMPQHLMCIRALKLISNAKVYGDSEGSTELIFEPTEIKTGEYVFNIGTAGSVSLLLQALLPPLIFAKDRSSLSLRGGTHVPFSPIFDYIDEVFIPILRRLGIEIEANIDNYGFYPKGGGRVRVEVIPAEKIIGINLIERGEIKKLKGVSGVGNLPLSIAVRQKDSALKILASHGLKADIEYLAVPAFGNGTFIFLKAETENCISGFSSLGERGKRAELVGEEVALSFLDYYSTNFCLDPHLADQIVLYLSFAQGESSFTTSQITGHLITNLWVIQKFLGTNYRIEGEVGRPGRVMISPSISP
jgi:RNA 3'-terminal phosphate cyclase (ATP)